jgi:TRAP-type C4-dicarboxylate transport system permease small subunit
MSVFASILRGLGLTVLLALVATVLWGWISRELGVPGRSSEELARVLLVWLSLLGAALAYAEHAHLGIDFVTTRFAPRTARLAACLGHVAAAVFALTVLVIGGGALTLERWQAGQVLAALGIPKAWMYAAAPVSGVAFLVLACGFLWRLGRPGLDAAGKGDS